MYEMRPPLVFTRRSISCYIFFVVFYFSSVFWGFGGVAGRTVRISRSFVTMLRKFTVCSGRRSHPDLPGNPEDLVSLGVSGGSEEGLTCPPRSPILPSEGLGSMVLVSSQERIASLDFMFGLLTSIRVGTVNGN